MVPVRQTYREADTLSRDHALPMAALQQDARFDVYVFELQAAVPAIPYL